MEIWSHVSAKCSQFLCLPNVHNCTIEIYAQSNITNMMFLAFPILRDGDGFWGKTDVSFGMVCEKLTQTDMTWMVVKICQILTDAIYG